MTFEKGVAALVEARQGGLGPLGAADLLSNWKAAPADYAEPNAVLSGDPAELLAFVQGYCACHHGRMNDLEFAVRNNIIPTRFQQ
ncbi:hypothetical protein [Streptomyces uncialis]|uniref:hypothetical protein n=1 Tax=Streptomyces uncialis TaxID=1048205 RepID=UPI00386746B0|nr:hypothetical protein OG924_35575 [Streptomyces uncialis]